MRISFLELEIKPSNIPNAGLGVFAKVKIQSRCVFGPYEGVEVHLQDVKKPDMAKVLERINKGGYGWKVCIGLTGTKCSGKKYQKISHINLC